MSVIGLGERERGAGPEDEPVNLINQTEEGTLDCLRLCLINCECAFFSSEINKVGSIHLFYISH